MIKAKLARRRIRPSVQVVAKSGNHGPCAIATLQVAVDDQARADRRGRVDMGFEQVMMRNISGEMVIEITHARPDAQCAEQRFAIAVQ